MEVKQHGRVPARFVLHLVGRNLPVTELAGVVGTPMVPHPIGSRESAIHNVLGRDPLKHCSLVHTQENSKACAVSGLYFYLGQTVPEP
jgi:hypothetical protein